MIFAARCVVPNVCKCEIVKLQEPCRLKHIDQAANAVPVEDIRNEFEKPQESPTRPQRAAKADKTS